MQRTWKVCFFKIFVKIAKHLTNRVNHFKMKQIDLGDKNEVLT